jgi:clan AA aspartic protease
MGLVYATLEVVGPRENPEAVEFLIDSGAVYSVLPQTVWKRLGLRPRRSMDFTLADGSHVTRGASEARFRYDDLEASSPVILGGRHDAALLGVVTLETLALVLDPFARTIRPWRHLPLKTCA